MMSRDRRRSDGFCGDVAGRWMVASGKKGMVGGPGVRAMVMVVVMVLLVASVGGGGGVARAAKSSSPEELTLTALTSSFYPAPTSLRSGYLSEGYGWDMVAEPHRELTITADRIPGAVYRWTFTEDADENADNQALDWSVSGTPTVWIDGEDETESARMISTATAGTVLSTMGPTVHMRALRGHAGSAWRLHVQARSPIPGKVMYETNVQIVVKYVRREIRQLSDEDRDRFLDALDTVYTLSADEGKAKYGKDFVNHDDLSLSYQGYKYQTSCTPYHEGTGFFDVHQAFFYSLERSLQLIDPSVALAYWDYVRDAQEMGTEWYKSPVLSLFGTPDSTGTLAGSGRFSHVKVPTIHVEDADDDTVASVANIYDMVMTPSSTNDSPYVQRFSDRGVCGIKTQALPSCPELMDAMSATTLASLDTRMEGNVLAPSHMIMSGAIDCLTDLGDLQARFPQFGEVWSHLASWGNVYWQTAWSAGDLTLPDKCSSGASFEDCRWTSQALENTLRVDGRVPYDVAVTLTAHVWSSISDMESVMELDPNDPTGAMYRFVGVTDKENDELITKITQFALQPPRMGHFAAGHAADPLFAVAHIQYERFYHVLKFNYEKRDFDMTYVDDSSCYGRSWEDVTPFNNFLGDTSGEGYTNAQIWDMFEPHKVSVPYMFESLDMDCAAADWEEELKSNSAGHYLPNVHAIELESSSRTRNPVAWTSSTTVSPSWEFQLAAGAVLASVIVPALVLLALRARNRRSPSTGNNDARSSLL